MAECDRAGIFKGEIIDYGLRDTDKSQSVAVSVRVNLTDWWDGAGWVPWREYDMQAGGDLWIIKKDGTLADDKVQSLVKYANWDGSLESLAGHTWMPTPCQVSVEEDKYKDTVRYRVGFINALDRTPGQVSTVSPEKAKDLAARFGAPLRALTGAAKKGAVPANGSKPVGPPPPKAPPVAAVAGAGSGSSSDIPF